MKRRLEYSDEKSNKFWEIEVIEKAVIVTYGKIGSDGQTLTKKFKSSDAASEMAEKQVEEKLKKGYRASSKVTLITYGKGTSAVEKSFYRRGRKDFFCVERIFEEGKIISKNTPVKNNKTGALVVSDYRSPLPDSNSRLVFSDTLSVKEKTQIRKAFREFGGFWMNVDDFEPEPNVIEITGQYELKEAEEVIIKLFGRRVEYCLMEVSKPEFNEYTSSGMPQSLFDELEANIVTSGAVFDERSWLSVNDNDLSNANSILKRLILTAKKKSPPPKTTPRRKECAYAAVTEKMMKRAWWGLTIYEPFDATKLNAEIGYDFVKGVPKAIETFTISYDGENLEFLEDLGSDYDDMYLVDSKGKRHPLDVLDEDPDDEDDSED